MNMNILLYTPKKPGNLSSLQVICFFAMCQCDYLTGYNCTTDYLRDELYIREGHSVKEMTLSSEVKKELLIFN
jgi:hypothetical protein